jgi:hypothetical protein
MKTGVSEQTSLHQPFGCQILQGTNHCKTLCVLFPLPKSAGLESVPLSPFMDGLNPYLGDHLSDRMLYV